MDERCVTRTARADDAPRLAELGRELGYPVEADVLAGSLREIAGRGDDVVLAADGTVYFTATIQNAAGSQTGQGFFRRQGGNLQRTFCYGDGLGTAGQRAHRAAVGFRGCMQPQTRRGRGLHSIQQFPQSGRQIAELIPFDRSVLVRGTKTLRERPRRLRDGSHRWFHRG